MANSYLTFIYPQLNGKDENAKHVKLWTGTCPHKWQSLTTISECHKTYFGGKLENLDFHLNWNNNWMGNFTFRNHENGNKTFLSSNDVIVKFLPSVSKLELALRLRRHDFGWRSTARIPFAEESFPELKQNITNLVENLLKALWLLVKPSWR